MRGPLLILMLGAALLRAQPADSNDPAEVEVTLGQQAYAANDDKTALQHFQSAYALKPTPLNAMRIFIVSCYAEPLSTSMGRMQVWLELKRADAVSRGDVDGSWASVKDAIAAATSGSKKLEDSIIQLQTEIAAKDARINELSQEITQKTITITTIKSGYDRQIGELKRQLEQSGNRSQIDRVPR